MEFSRKNTWVGCHSLLQGIFPTQGSNLGLLHCRQIHYHLSHQGSPVERALWTITRMLSSNKSLPFSHRRPESWKLLEFWKTTYSPSKFWVPISWCQELKNSCDMPVPAQCCRTAVNMVDQSVSQVCTHHHGKGTLAEVARTCARQNNTASPQMGWVGRQDIKL